MVTKTRWAVLSLAAAALLSAVARGDITVERDGDDLFVIGSNQADSVRVSLYYSAVSVVDLATNTVVYSESGHPLGTTVSVNTGNGDDYVELDNYLTQTTTYISVDTGNGADDIYLDSPYLLNEVDIDSGRGDDYCWAYSGWSFYNGGSLAIDTGTGDDICELYMYRQIPLDVRLDQGDDILIGENGGYDPFWSPHPSYPFWSPGAFGTVDAGKGEDSRAGFTANSNTLDILNFEE
jgi:hypothetical protein